MHENMLAIAHRLSDVALIARLKALVGRERDATVELVAHLAELSARKLDLEEGPGALYVYCRDTLGLSEDAAYNRAAAARAVRSYPVILGMLADGSLTLTAVKLLRPLLTAENHRAVLADAKHRSRAEVDKLVARLNPQPDVPSTIRKLPPPAAGIASAPAVPAPRAEGALPRANFVATPPALRPIVAPLAPERYRLQFTVSQGTHDRLRRLQELMRREIPDGDPAAIFDRALVVLLREVEKKKMKATTRPGPPRGTKAGSRAIPTAVARAVWKRDESRCAFLGRSGRCTQRSYLELHHVMPYGHQGPATFENISLRCRAHNVYESELVFGPFAPDSVRESRENYAVSGEFPPVPERPRPLRGAAPVSHASVAWRTARSRRMPAICRR